MITVSVTPSLGERVFALNRWPDVQTLKIGDVVRFPFTDAVTGGQTVHFLKRVGCLPGQHLLVDQNKDYYCDGKYLGRAKGHNLKGEPVSNFVYDGPVPQSMFFAVASHKDSYDSRYYGFVDLRRITEKAYPLF